LNASITIVQPSHEKGRAVPGAPSVFAASEWGLFKSFRLPL
jgi:hypothetical protein